MPMRFAGWLLHPEDRDRPLALFPPAYPRMVAHHVTLRAGVRPDHPLPGETQCERGRTRCRPGMVRESTLAAC